MNTTQIRELLQKRKLKVTPTRLNLLSEMDKYGSAMSHSTIQNQLNPIDRVTLYRTLEILKEKGIIHKAFQENNEIYYAICGVTCEEHQHHHEHIHFKCLKCNIISCKEVNNSSQISLPNHEIHKVSINIEGVCDGCCKTISNSSVS